MNEYFGDFLIDTTQPFFFYKDSEVSYGTPDASADRDGYAAHIELLPLLSGPEVFGLHSNAEIDYLTVASATILSNLIELQPRTAAGGGGASRESIIGSVAADISSKLPEAFDLPKLKKMLPTPSPTQVYLPSLMASSFIRDLILCFYHSLSTPAYSKNRCHTPIPVQFPTSSLPPTPPSLLILASLLSPLFFAFPLPPPTLPTNLSAQTPPIFSWLTSPSSVSPTISHFSPVPSLFR